MDVRIIYSHPRQRIEEVQRLLASRGYYTGPINGQLDDATQAALAEFQGAENLPVTGRITPITLARLQQAAAVYQVTAPKPFANRNNLALPRANILINRGPRRLTLFDGNKPVRQYPVAIGKPSTPTPLGNFAIVSKIMNPGGVLGSRWLGLNYDSYGIHGTNRPWLIGQMVSNGCIRMHNHDVEELFVLVNLGTPVYIRD